MIVAPTFGVGLSTDFATAMSALAPALTDAPAELLLVFGSGWSAALTATVLVSAPGTSMLATMSNVALSPLASAPIVHRPDAGT